MRAGATKARSDQKRFAMLATAATEKNTYEVALENFDLAANALEL
jgi:hypothetical protein